MVATADRKHFSEYRAGHLASLLLVLLVAIVEIVAFPENRLVLVLAIVGVVAAVSGAHLELSPFLSKFTSAPPSGAASAGGAAFVGGSLRTPAAAPPASSGGLPPVTHAVPTRAARGVQADPRMAFPAPPRFDERGSTAHARPWLLPAVPSATGVAADEALLGGLVVRAASVVGPGHRCEEPAKPRQDAYQLGRDRTGRFLVVAVTDGISSSAFSDLGAATAATAAVRYVVDLLNSGGRPADLSARSLFGAVSDAMIRTADAHRLTPADVCCVATVAVLDSAPDRGGGRAMWLGRLGDVSVWLRGDQRWEQVIGPAKARADGLHSSEVDAYLPQRPAAAQGRGVMLPGGATVAVVTDGVGDLWTAHQPANAYFHERWGAPIPVPLFLNDVCFDARGEQDDRTAVVIWSPAGAAR